MEAGRKKIKVAGLLPLIVFSFGFHIYITVNYNKHGILKAVDQFRTITMNHISILNKHTFFMAPLYD